MNCLLCGKKLPFLRKLKNGDFCSETHKTEFFRQQNQAAVSRLLAAGATAPAPPPLPATSSVSGAQAAKPQRTPARRSSKRSAQDSPAAGSYLPFAFSWLDRSGEHPRSSPPEPEPREAERILPGIVKVTPRTRRPPSVCTVLQSLASPPATAPPLPATQLRRQKGYLPAKLQPAFARVHLTCDAPDWHGLKQAAVREPEREAASPPPAGAVAHTLVRPALRKGSRDLRPLWAQPVTIRSDWRPATKPRLQVKLALDPASDPYSAAREEGCGLVPLVSPRPRAPRPAGLAKVAAAIEDAVSPAPTARLTPATPANRASVPYGAKLTDSLTRPVAGAYRLISLFPRPSESKLRCRAPQGSQASTIRRVTTGERIGLPLQAAGAVLQPAWIGCDPAVAPPRGTLFPQVRLNGPSIRERLGTILPMGLHPKTRGGASASLVRLAPSEMKLTPPQMRPARMAGGVQNDWLTVMAGLVALRPLDARTGLVLPCGGDEWIGTVPAAPDPSTIDRGTSQTSFALKQAVKQMPLSIDTIGIADAEKAPRGEFTPTWAPALVVPNSSRQAARCPWLSSDDDELSISAWTLALRKLMRRGRATAKLALVGGGVVALAAVLTVGPGSFGGASSSPEAGDSTDTTVSEEAAPETAKPLVASLKPSAPPVTATPPPSAPTSVSMWDGLQQRIGERAAIAFTDDFRNGLSAWTGAGNWARNWSYDAAGFIRTGPLALYSPSLDLTDYRMEFLGQIEIRSMGWVVRASDLRNYHACKLVIVSGGPQPTIAIERYRVLNGRVSAVRRRNLPMQLQEDTVYQIQTDVRGNDFSVTVQGTVVDSWSDDSIPRGGIGFFSSGGERARLRWVGVWHQYDMLGRLCAFLAPAGLPGR